jgi:hypothetical protein
MQMVKMSRSSRRKQYLAMGYPLCLRVGQEASIRTWDIVFVSSFMCRLVGRQEILGDYSRQTYRTLDVCMCTFYT